MASQQTLDALFRFARQGNFVSVQIEFSADQLNPEAGSEVALRWRIEDATDARAVLVLDGQARGVPLAGRHRLRVGAQAQVVQIQCDGQHSALTLTPWVRVPQFTQFDVPQSAFLGVPVALRWAIDECVTATLIVRSPAGVESRQAIAPQGALALPCPAMGAWHIRIEANSTHAHLNAAATVARNLTVQVFAPPVVWAVALPAALHGPVGTEVSVPLSVRGAVEVWALMQFCEATPIAPGDLLFAEVWGTPYDLTIETVALDGVRARRSVRIAPQSEPDIEMDLTSIIQPVELTL